MERERDKNSGRVFLGLINLLAVICVLSFIAGAAYTKAFSRLDSGYSKLDEDRVQHNSKPDNEQFGEWRTVRMRVTAYCPCRKCCGQYSDGITACGHKIQPGDTFVAADGRYSFGTEMLIPGYSNNQPVKVLDRGGAIKGNKLDVFFATHQEALEWGVKRLDVKVHYK